MIWSGAAVLVAVALRLLAMRRGSGPSLRPGDPELTERFVRLPAVWLPRARTALLATGVGLAALAASWGSRQVDTPVLDELEIMIVLDASNSMLAEDAPPSRLQAQRELAANLARRLASRTGVVYFAGRAYTLSPLTGDKRAVDLLIREVRPSAVGLGGSSIAAGLSLALDVLAGGEEGSRKAIVLFSDGEATVEAPLDDAAERARRANIAVHAVGIGTEQGGNIPMTREALIPPSAGSLRSSAGVLLRSRDGQPVVTRLEEEPLRRIALMTGGAYANFRDGTDQIERELASARGAAPAGRAGVMALLLLAFLCLWAEGFALPRG